MKNTKKTKVTEALNEPEVSAVSVEDVKTTKELVVEEKLDIAKLDKEDELEARQNGTISTLTDKVRSKLVTNTNKGFLSFLEYRNPKLVMTGRTQVSRANYTEEEMIYFMKSNFDYFVMDGTCYYDRGRNLGGTYLPTGTSNFAVCKIEDFADYIMREGDSNWGRHKYSYEDSTRPTWYKKKITKYNLSKFLVDYCEGKTLRMDGVGALPTAEKDRLLELAKEIDIKNGKK